MRRATNGDTVWYGGSGERATRSRSAATWGCTLISPPPASGLRLKYPGDGRHQHAAPHPEGEPRHRCRRPLPRLVPAELLRGEVHAGARLPGDPREPEVRRDPRPEVL